MDGLFHTDVAWISHIRNFSIDLRQRDHGNYYLFGYDEYDGGDYTGDKARLDSSSGCRKW